MTCVSGQYASDPTGAPVPGDFAAQVEPALDRLPAQTLSGVALLALPGMLFEVDGVAVRPAGRG